MLVDHKYFYIHANNFSQGIFLSFIFSFVFLQSGLYFCLHSVPLHKVMLCALFSVVCTDTRFY